MYSASVGEIKRLCF